MSYADSLLASGERIVRRERQHWFVLAWSARYALGAVVVALALVLAGLAMGDSGGLVQLMGYGALALFVGGVAWVVWSWLRYRYTEFVVTSRRIIHASGVINKRATDSSLEKINDAVLSESFFGRIFGFGDLDVLTASETGIEKLRMLRDAKGYKRSMLEAKHDLELEYTRPVMPPLRAGNGGERPAAAEPPQPVVPVPPLAAPEPMLVVATAGPAPAPLQRVTPDPEVQATQSAAPEPAPAPAPPAPPVPPRPSLTSTLDEITVALDRLADLRDRGIITPEEFDAKKQELLARL
jgi:hypothetical protein